MNGKDDGKKKRKDPFIDSNELFNKIFKEATQEIRLEKRTKKQSPHVVSAPASGRWRLQTKIPGTKKSPTPVAEPEPNKSERFQAVAKPEPDRAKSIPSPRNTFKPDKRKGKRSSVFMGAALLILLAILAGTVLGYMGIIDISSLLNYFEPTREQATQSPIRAKQPIKPSEKAVNSPRQPLEQVPTPSVAPTKSTPSVVSKEEKLPELETTTTILQAKSDKEQVEEKVPPVSITDQSTPPDVAAKDEQQPVPVQTQVLEKPSVPEVVPPHPRTSHYPYSVYLGSFKSAKAVSKAMSEYHERGLSPYWARVDLGDKGVWFRFFAGHFQTKEEAEKFIRESNVPGASLGVTRYANLIGIYSSDEEVEHNRRVLLSAGFYPYIIQSSDGKRFLYSGAFDRKEYAEKERTSLASKGIKSQTTER